MTSGLRQPAKEVVPAGRVLLEFTMEPQFPKLDETLLRKHFANVISKFPAPNVLVTLQVRDRTTGCLLLDCVGLSGEPLTTFSFPDQQQVTLGELRQKLVEHTGIRRRDLKLLLPSGRILARADNPKSLADIFANA
eukprot:TRINITY_DN19766_c0_g1_i1.p3 TRINITY_DN19766_c0_g1~~TRINITY_DN19766_c0_g1_i1.p3  ORF type:complete len:136 (+),score=23.31 TRINITY_DN19766_c0_g1_i1:1402-1809(+)